MSMRLLPLLVAASLALAGCDVFFSAPGEMSTIGWEDLGFLSAGQSDQPSVVVLTNGEVYAAYHDSGMSGTVAVVRLAGDKTWVPLSNQPATSAPTSKPRLLAYATAMSTCNLRLFWNEGMNPLQRSALLDSIGPMWTYDVTGIAGQLLYLDVAQSADLYSYYLLARTILSPQTNWVSDSGAPWSTNTSEFGYGAIVHTTSGTRLAFERPMAGGGLSVYLYSSGILFHESGITMQPVHGFDLCQSGDRPVIVYASAENDYRLWVRVNEWDPAVPGYAWRDLGGDAGGRVGAGREIAAVADDSEIFVAYLDDSSPNRLRVSSLRDGRWRDWGYLGNGAARDIHIQRAPDGDIYVAFTDDDAGARARVFRLAH